MNWARGSRHAFIANHLLLVCTLTVITLRGALPAKALTNSTDDVDSAAANAVVNLIGITGPNQCTGVLISPTLVLTAGHCEVISRAPAPAGSSVRNGNWETPGAWYPLGQAIEVGIGNDAMGVHANADRPGTWESFTVEDLNGGTLSHMEQIRLKTSANYYLVAESGGTSFLGANRRNAGAWETFMVWRIAGQGVVGSGDRIALQSPLSQNFVVAEGGGGGVLNVDGPNRGAGETFIVERAQGAGAVSHNDVVRLGTPREPTGSSSDVRNYVTAEGGGGGFKLRATATDYNIAGWADLTLLRLTTPIPSAIATPVEVVTSRPTVDWTRQQLLLVGWGGAKRYRKIADGRNAEYPCNRGDLVSAQTICPRNGSNGAAVEGGDSGGPLLWRGPAADGRSLVGVLQGTQSPSQAGGSYTVTFNSSESGIIFPPTGFLRPAIGSWLESILHEDCIAFPTQNLQVVRAGRHFNVMAGGQQVLDSFGSERDASLAIAISTAYGFNQYCAIQRPHREVRYFLTGDHVPPSGSVANEDCAGFDPATLSVEQKRGRWKVVNGTTWLFDYDQRLSDAWKTVYTLARYGFNQVCYVGNPNRRMMYLKKQ